MKKIFLFLFLLLTTGSLVLGQTVQISGIVTSSEDNLPIAGVSVTVKGTTVGAISGADGKYSLVAPLTSTTLMYSFIGFKTQQILIDGKTRIDVVLEQDISALDEVVVVAYGTQQRRDVTGSVSSVRGDAIKNVPVQSFDQALQGKAAGVMITVPNGVLNNPPVIRIRGFNSISSSSYPLVVVDGVPIFTGDVSSNSAANNALADINPSDIQSMEILKDASATAIYGSRAANGVVLITTKRGSGPKTKVTYDGYFGYTQPYRLFDLMNATQYVEHKNLAWANYPSQLASAFTIPVDVNGNPVDTKWSDYVYQTGFQHSHSFTFSGSTPSTNYFLSLGYTNQEGMIQKNTYTRKSARLNLDHKLNKFITLGANISISNSFNQAPNTGSLPGQGFNTGGAGRLAFVLPPNLRPYNDDGSYNIAGAAIGNNGQPVANYGYYNPVAIFDLNRFTSQSDRLLGSLSATAVPFKGLTLKTVYGIDNLAVETQTYQTGLTGDAYADNGSATNTLNRPLRWTWTNTANYDLILAEKFNMGFLVGVEEQYTRAEDWNGSKTNVTDPFLQTYQGTYVIAGMGSGGMYKNYFISYFGRINLNYDKKYYVELSARRDGFSGLSEGNKFGTFGGASVMWNISRESFISDGSLNDIFSDMRFKASYGKVGNMSGIGSYSSQFLYQGGVYGSAPTWRFNQAGNPDLAWEASDKYDLGLSFGLLKDKIQVDMNWYYNDVNDLILDIPQSPSKGIPGNTIPINIGSMYNTGLELSFTSYNISTPNFSWTTTFNISSMKNEVTELAPGVTEIVGITSGLETTSRTLPGYPIGNIFGIETRGVDPTTGRRVFVNAAGVEVLYSHESPAVSRWTYRDGSGNAPAIALTSDGKVLGSPLPKIFGGIDNSFNYKDFDLALNLTYSLGAKVYNGSKAGLRDQRWWNNSVEVYETAWKNPGEVTNIPKPIFNDNISNGSAFVISENVENADFMKIRNVSLGYTLKNLPSETNIERIRFYGQITNAFVFTNYSGSDPEVSANGNSNLTPGIDRNTVPQARTYTFGINVSF